MKHFNTCPHCGQKISSYHQNQSPPDQSSLFQSVYKSAVANADFLPPNFKSYTRKIPTRGPDLASDFTIPLFQAIAWAGFLTIPASFAVFHFAPKLWDFYTPLYVFGSLLPFTWGYAWADIRAGLYAVEKIIQHDINGDKQIGKPQKEPIPLNINVKNDKGSILKQLRLDLPPDMDEGDFRNWADLVVNGKSMAIANWTGKGKPFTRSAYEEFLDKMVEGGIVRWVDSTDKSQGRELTPHGKLSLKGYLHLSPHVDTV